MNMVHSECMVPMPMSNYSKIGFLKGREDLPSDVWKLIYSFKSQLNNLIQTVEELSQNLKNGDLRMSLCHTVLHNWNLMQPGQELMLIDWKD